MANTLYSAGSSKGNSIVLRQREYGLAKDGTLQKTMDALKACKKELEDLNNFVKKVCDLPTDHKRSIFGKLMYHLVPRRVYSVVPRAMLKIMAEEYDVLELIERLQRENVNNVQDALRDLCVGAAEKRQELNDLEADLRRAQEENWSARQLQDYMASKSGVELYEIVAQLLDSEFKVLSDEEKGKRKDDLLAQLLANIVLGGTLMETMSRVVSAGLEVFHRGMSQYFAYVHFYKPISIIRESAKTMVDMNRSMYAGKEALIANFQASLRAIEASLEAAKMWEQYSVTAPDMKNLLEAGQKRLEQKMKAVEAARETNRSMITVMEVKKPVALPAKASAVA